MSYHKYKFPIRLNYLSKEKIDIVSGWSNEDCTIGFYKTINGNWSATDLCTGTRICNAKTRNECMDWINENQEKIMLRRLENGYLNLVFEFEKIIKEKIRDLNYIEIIYKNFIS